MKATKLSKKYDREQAIKDKVVKTFGYKKVAINDKVYILACKVANNLIERGVILPENIAEMTSSQLTRLNKELKDSV